MGDRAIVDVQNPIRLGERSEPQPDVALLKSRPDFYAGVHPGPDDTLLLVEVMEHSVAYDREVKVPLYARSGIPEAWLVDLEEVVVEVYQAPSPQGYQRVARLGRGDRLAPQTFPELVLMVDEIL